MNKENEKNWISSTKYNEKNVKENNPSSVPQLLNLINSNLTNLNFNTFDHQSLTTVEEKIKMSENNFKSYLKILENIKKKKKGKEEEKKNRSEIQKKKLKREILSLKRTLYQHFKSHLPSIPCEYNSSEFFNETIDTLEAKKIFKRNSNSPFLPEESSPESIFKEEKREILVEKKINLEGDDILLNVRSLLAKKLPEKNFCSKIPKKKYDIVTKDQIKNIEEKLNNLTEKIKNGKIYYKEKNRGKCNDSEVKKVMEGSTQTTLNNEKFEELFSRKGNSISTNFNSKIPEKKGEKTIIITPKVQKKIKNPDSLGSSSQNLNAKSHNEGAKLIKYSDLPDNNKNSEIKDSLIIKTTGKIDPNIVILGNPIKRYPNRNLQKNRLIDLKGSKEVTGKVDRLKMKTIELIGIIDEVDETSRGRRCDNSYYVEDL